MNHRSLSRRGFLRATALAGGLTALGLPEAVRAAPGDPAMAEEVRREFLTAWNAYKRLCWGRDELLPRSGRGSDFFFSGHSVGLTIVESLDTLFFMELDDEVARGVDWIRDNLDFDIDDSIQVFEATIRMVGGLLSGYHCTGDRMLLDRARELADRMLPAFTRSPTGMPYRYVNLRTGAVSDHINNLAEIGTSIAEFGDLSRLVGDSKYFDASKRALRAVFDRRSSLGLVGTYLNVETGSWTDDTARIDPPVDSFFEYLWDGWDLFGDADLRRWYTTLTQGVLTHLAETSAGRLWFRSVNRSTGQVVGRGQSELAAFYAGLLAQGGNVAEGERYHDSWTAVLGKYRLPPEAINYTNLSATSAAYWLRPEYADAAFMLWLVTGKEVYRERGRDLFNRQKAHCKVANGYTVVTDVRTTPMRLGDLTPGYWYSENMKYYYLLFADSPRFDYANNYLSTEGNVLRGVKR